MQRFWFQFMFVLLVAASTLAGFHPSTALALEFDRIVIDDNFPGAYQVEVADVNGDGRPDIVAVGGGTCAWFENPSWKKRIVTTPDQTPGIISSATTDLDGDGKAEIAIAYMFAMNEPTRGKLLLAGQGKRLDDPWTVAHVADIGSIHRLRWYYQLIVTPNSVRLAPVPAGPGHRAREEGFRGTTLVVAPLFGPSAKPPGFDQEPAQLVSFSFGPRVESKSRSLGPRGGIGGGGIGGGLQPSGPPAPLLLGKWEHPGPRGSRIGEAAVLHAIDVVDVDGHPIVLAASNLGVTRHYVAVIAGAPLHQSEALVSGVPGEAPKKGASEVHAGRLKDGRRFLATVEPWHGTDVAVYLSESLRPRIKFGPRILIDTSLKEGHALWVADVDGDGDDEVFAGYRGPGTSVLLFDFDGKTWVRTVIDPSIAAQDLRGGDLDGDGIPDVVAAGGRSHNVIWYKFRAQRAQR